MTHRPVYTPETLGERWEVSAQSIRDRLQRGALRGFRWGKLWRIPSSEVERIEAGEWQDREESSAIACAPSVASGASSGGTVTPLALDPARRARATAQKLRRS